MTTMPLPGIRDLFRGFLHLIYPQLCVSCDADLPSQQYCFCLSCQRQLQLTNMHHVRENEFTDRFWGRLPLESGAAMYYFHRKSPIQRALHRLKYKNQPDIGIQVGRRFGQLLAMSPHFRQVEAIVPVPLHPRKERMRSYNQSAMLAQGIADAMDIPVHLNALVRDTFSASQTRKKRMERFENVQSVFAIQGPEHLAGKHLLLVDDVLTTGATLEACGNALLSITGLRLSMATIAIAMH